MFWNYFNALYSGADSSVASSPLNKSIKYPMIQNGKKPVMKSISQKAIKKTTKNRRNPINIISFFKEVKFSN